MSTNPKLEAIGVKAAELFQASMREAANDILQAWDVAVEEAQANDKNPILAVGFTLKLDLGSNRLETALGFSVRRKFECSAEIPDPNQPDLPLEGSKVSIQTGDGPPIEVYEVSKAASKKAAKKKRPSHEQN
jgi:hypothetical protein